MKINKYASITAAVTLVLLMSLSAAAQKKKPAPAPSPAPNPNVAEIQAGSANAASELKKVVRFVYLLGGVAQGIEDIDQQVKTGKVSRTVMDQNEQFKQNVVQSIHNLGSGLAALEVEFRTKAGLRPFASKVEGITAKSGMAEDLAAAGRFKDAGKELLGLVEQLADALVALP